MYSNKNQDNYKINLVHFHFFEQQVVLPISLVQYFGYTFTGHKLGQLF